MENKKELTKKEILKSKVFITIWLFSFFIILGIFIWFFFTKIISETIFLSEMIIGSFLIIISLIGFINSMIPQNDKYQENQTMFKYSHKYLYFALKKKPYGIIEFNKIEKVEKIATDIGLPVLIKVYTKDGEIHYIGNNELQGAFLYALKERGLKDLVEEERRGISFIRRYILRLKGGKVVKR